MTSFFTRARVAGALALALTLLSAQGSQAEDAAAIDLSGTTLIIGQNNYDLQPGILASSVLADTPYKIEFASFANGNETLGALSTGAIDVTLQSVFGAALAQAAAKPAWTADDVPYKAVTANRNSGDVDHFQAFVTIASVKSGITEFTADAVRGKTWSAPPGGTSYLSQLFALKSLGLTPKDVKLVSLNATDGAVALLTGDVDLVSSLIYQYSDAISDGAKVIATATHYGGDAPGVLYANSASLKDPAKHAALADFLVRYIKFRQWWYENPELAQQSLIKARKLSPEAAKLNWTYSRSALLYIDEALLKETQSIADTASAFGALPRKIDTSITLDPQFNDLIRKTATEISYDAKLKQSYDVK